MANPKSHRSYKVTKKNIRNSLSLLEKNLNDAINQMTLGANEAVDTIAKEIHDRSLKIAPEDTGELKDSIYIASEKEGNNYTVEVGYKADHAVFAHTNANRGRDYEDPTTPDTHWQFLLFPTQEVESEIPKIISDSIQKSLKG